MCIKVKKYFICRKILIMMLQEVKNKINKKKILIAGLFVAVVACRLLSTYGLDVYSDEEEILSCIDSIIKTGKDVYGQSFPLFSRIGAGSTTFAFIYPMVLVCLVIKAGVLRVRWVLQIITIASCVLVSATIKVWTNNKKIALVVLFVLLTLPWGFVQANRIWDPTLVPLYFSIFFFFYVKLIKEKNSPKREYLYCVISFSSLVLLATVYPPNRIPAVALWIYCFIYALKNKKINKIEAVLIFVFSTLFALPLAYSIFFQSGFNNWASMLIVFKGENLLKEFFKYMQNICSYFSFNYLFVTGDVIPRHSLPIFGVLGTVNVIPTVYILINGKEIYRNNKHLISLMVFIIIFTLLSVGLTDEYHPHTLRSCLCWIPLGIIIACSWYELLRNSSERKIKCLLLLFFTSFIAWFIFDILITRSVLCF